MSQKNNAKTKQNNKETLLKSICLLLIDILSAFKAILYNNSHHGGIKYIVPFPTSPGFYVPAIQVF